MASRGLRLHVRRARHLLYTRRAAEGSGAPSAYSHSAVISLQPFDTIQAGRGEARDIQNDECLYFLRSCVGVIKADPALGWHRDDFDLK